MYPEDKQESQCVCSRLNVLLTLPQNPQDHGRALDVLCFLRCMRESDHDISRRQQILEVCLWKESPWSWGERTATNCSWHSMPILNAHWLLLPTRVRTPVPSLLSLRVHNQMEREVQEFHGFMYIWSQPQGKFRFVLLYFLTSLLRVVASVTSLVRYVCRLATRICCDPHDKSHMPICPFELRGILLCLPGQPFCFRCLVLMLLFGFWNSWYSKHISGPWTSVNPCCSF